MRARRIGGISMAQYQYYTITIMHADDRDSIHLQGTLEDLKILDVGCGGGILSEALAKSGAKVLGIDSSDKLIAIAKKHLKDDFSTWSEKFGLPTDYSKNLDYGCISVQELAKSHEGTFDIVVISEVLEHIENDLKAEFLKHCITLANTNGIIVITTPGRSLKSCLVNIILAEVIFCKVPKGTHQYDMFQSPQDICNLLAPHGCVELLRQGVFYLPFLRRFIHVNTCDYLYMISFTKQL
ncbi:bifunctional S-adenosyl-L-methionine-dependent methyltransferase superfamily/Ubiquinone biosynthesis O-methyltransferase [Babesia duncani]|uniref:Bifunctional S-adenosyl-L-methionine-dependent methyltransferase superfamily/Ubiquinone biosynthesis O-methyltransferase n=1 Tax=Babesia duncani TaxID=323732 RepID=A0AAD9PIP1_9APIC|nr:bifunctional S-adenosyl-L-methionine-dependent methyltransferase superfamily/Ubiquinone biosynthesis O-methyltransferase [Babesia duncani]